MTLNDRLGHIGYIFVVVGMLLLAQQNVWGWPMRAIGELIWLWIGLRMKMSSIWIWGAIFIILDIYGFIQWITL